LEEANFPTAIKHPTRAEKGAEKATIAGREYRISRATSRKGTFFERTSSARSRSWLMKNTQKKNKKAVKVEKMNSAPMYP